MSVRSKKIQATEIVEKQVGNKIIRKSVLKASSFISKTGVKIEKCYCRKCMELKNPDDFFDCVDNGFIDANGKMSVCKDCCNKIFDNIYESVSYILDRAILKTCRYLNVMYYQDAVDMTASHIETMKANGKSYDRVFGIYKGKLHSITNRTDFKKKTASADDLTFSEPMFHEVEELDETVDDRFELQSFWGTGLEYDDYVWLEKELSEWKKTHKCDTKAEEVLLREVCLTGLAIRKARQEGRSPGGLIKEYQDLMKTANVDPAKTAIAGAGKSQDTFSAFIKTIEENEPAEYFSDKPLFKDFDKIDFYFQKYVRRPLENFITQSRNFDVTSEDDSEDFNTEELLAEQ